MYEFQNYALHESIVIVLRYDGTSSVWFQSLAEYFVMLYNTRKLSLLVSPGFPSSYLIVLKFHQLYLALGIIERWNKLHNTIVLQDNTFQNILYIEIIHL